MRTQLLAGALCAAVLAYSAFGQNPDSSVPSPDAATAEALKLEQAAQSAAAQPAPAADSTPTAVPTPTPTVETGQLNFNDAEISVVLKYISDKTGKAVIKGDGVDKKVTLINPKVMTVEENLALLYKVLTTLGIAVVDTGDLIMVVPQAEARKIQQPVVQGNELDPSQKGPVTYSRTLKFAKAQELLDRLKPMVRDPESLAADTGSNTIIFADSPPFVDRIDDLINLIDRPAMGEVRTEARAIRNASATELVEPLMRYMENFSELIGEATPRTRIRVEPSLNTLILRGPAQEVDAAISALERLEGSGRDERQKVTRTRKLNKNQPEETLQQAYRFLRHFASAAGFPGDVPKSKLTYDPLSRTLIMRGPVEELDALAPILDEIDPLFTTLERKVNYTDPEMLARRGIRILAEEFKAEGRVRPEPSITWVLDTFNPSLQIFRGPADEITRLVAILDKIDKPTVVRNRSFFTREPEDIFPEALDLLSSQYLQEGQPNRELAVSWRRDPLNPANIVITGPEEEITRILAILDQLDKPTAQRTRTITEASPEVVIPQAIEILIDEFEKAGQANYKPTILWERERFNPTVIVFEGPPTELDRLFTILDQLDKPRVTLQRRFYKSPEEVFPLAFDLLRQRYAEEGRPDYRLSVEWKRDLLNPALINIKGPQEEITRLTPILEEFDKTTARRTRMIQEASPEVVIPQALNIMIEEFAKEGLANYKPSIKWERERFNRNVIVFDGPPTELDRLIPILDQLDKPLITLQRRFFKSPEDVFPQALAILEQQYAEEGRPDYRLSIDWKRDILNPAMINIRAPQEEITKLTPILEEIDKTKSERPRPFYSLDPETAIPEALAKLVQYYSDQGRPNYQPSIKWKRDEFNKSTIVFEGPPTELDVLIPLLERMDPPLVVSRRAIVNATPEAVIAPATERLKQYFRDQNRPDYQILTTFRVDPLTQELVMRGPQEEITALTQILTEIDKPYWQDRNVITQQFPVSIAVPSDLIEAASDFVALRVRQEGQPGDVPGIEYRYDPTLKSILLRGPTDQIGFAVEVMNAVERNTRRGMKPFIIHPKFVNAATLYSELTTLFAGLYVGMPPPAIGQVPRLNALVVSAKPEDRGFIEDWVTALDREGSADQAVRVVPIENAIPSTLAAALRSLFPSSSGVLYPDDTAARIVIRDSTPSIEKIVDLIGKLDEPVEGEDLVLEVKNLKTASAYYAYSALNEFSNQLALIRGSTKSRARVVYEPTSSSILFFGRNDDVRELMEVADKLDRVALAGTRPKVVSLKNSQAANIASQLNQLLPRITSQQSPPVVVPDPISNRLIIATAPSDATKVEELITQLDSSQLEEVQPTFIQLQNADAATVAAMLGQINPGVGKILSDVRTGSLIILDTTASVSRLKPIIDELDSPEAAQDLTLEIYRTKAANAYYMYSTLSEYARQLAVKQGKGRSRALVQYEPATSAVIILGSRAEVDELLSVAERMDTNVLADVKPRFVTLKNAQAAGVAAQLNQLLPRITNQQTPPLVIPDPISNRLIVATSVSDATKVESLIAQLDSSQLEEMQPTFIQLQNADPSTVSSMLSQINPGVGKILPDLRTGSLIILDTTASISRLRPIIDELDSPEAAQDLTLEIYRTKSANAYYMYSTLSEYARQLALKQGKGRSRALVQYEPATSAVIILGSRDEVKELLSVAERMDTNVLADVKPRFISLKNAQADLLASRLNILLPALTSQQNPPRIMSEARLNMLIVAASPKDASTVLNLIEQIDVPGVGGLASEVIQLENADAVTLATSLKPLTSEAGKLIPDTRTNSLLILDSTDSIQRVKPFIAKFDDADIREQFQVRVIPVKTANVYAIYNPLTTYVQQLSRMTGNVRMAPQVTAEPSTQSIIVIGRESDVKDIIRISEELDRLQWEGAEPEFISIKNAIASTVAVSVRQVLPSVSKGGASVQIVPDDRINSIIVVAQPSGVERIRGLIEKLDVKDAGDLILRILPLESAQASTLYSPLSVLKSPRGYVTYDYTSNALIIRDTSASVSIMEEIVKKLDVEGSEDLQTKIIPLKEVIASSIYTPIYYLKSPRGNVAYDTTSNSLIIRDNTATIEVIEKVINDLDVPGTDGLQTKVIPLKAASAVSLYSPLTNLKTPRGYVMYDANSNSIILRDTASSLEFLEGIVHQLDTPETTGELVTKIVTVRNIDVSQATSMISQLATQLANRKGRSGAPQTSAYSESNTGSVVIVGVSEEVSMMSDLIDKLEAEGQVTGNVQLFFLKHTKAYTLANQLRQVYQSGRRGSQQTVVIGDEFTNSIIAIGSQQDLQKLEELAKQLDIPNAAGLEVEIFPLDGVSATLLATRFQPLLGPQGSVFGDANTNSLVIIDSPDVIGRIKKIVDELSARGLTGTTMFTRKLEYGQAGTLIQPINQYLTFEARRQGLTTPNVGVYAEPSTNSVVIFGPTDEVKDINTLIDELDSESLSAREPKIFPLSYVQAAQIAPQLSSLLTQGSLGGIPPALVAEPNTNSLIVMAAESDLTRIGEVLKQIDIPDTGGLETKVYQLKHSSASTIAGNLTPPMLSARGKAFAELGTNSLVVIDTPAAHEQVRGFLDQIDLGRGQVVSQVRRLENASVSSLSSALQQFITHQSQMKGLTRPLTQIMSDPLSNTVIVYGPTDEVKDINTLIDELDSEALSAREPKIFPLSYVQAAQIAPQLSSLLTQGSLGGIPPALVAEPNTNSLIVMAAESDMTRIGDVLKQIDVPEAGGLETKVYQLKHSSAATIAGNLTPPMISVRGKAFAELGTNSVVVTDTPSSHERIREFLDQIDLGRGQVVSQVRRLENASISTLSSALQQFVTHQAQMKGLTRPLTQIMSDPQSNTVIVYGPTDEVDLVMGVIDQLDGEALFERAPKIVPLRSARAERVAPVLQQLLGPQRTGPNAARVVADPESNTVIIIAPEADLIRAEALIAELDKAEFEGIETRIFRLKNAEATLLATSLRTMVGQPTKLFADPTSNSIVYSDTTPNLDQLQTLITQLDSSEVGAGMITKVRPLRNSTAQVLDNTLTEFAQHISQRKGRVGRPLTRVASDASTNAVVVIGPTDEVDLLVALIDQLDADGLRDRKPQVFFLQRAQATEVATQLSQVMASLGQGPNAARIVPNAQTNSLLVLATPADLALVEQVITTLEQDEAGQRKPRLYRLKNADALSLVNSLRATISPSATLSAHPDSNSIVYTDTEENITKLFDIIKELDLESRPEDIVSEIVNLENTSAGAITQPLQTIISQLSTTRRRLNKPPLQAFADPQANAVVVVGSSDEVSQIAGIVKKLDSESLSERQPEVFFLEYARAADIARELTTLFSQTARYGNPPRIASDEWANAVLVFADPRDLEWIRKLIGELDTREGRKRVVEIFILENADATILADRLQELFVPGSGTGTSTRRRSPYADSFGGAQRTMSLTEGQVTIIPDQRLNALVVTAEPQDMSQVEALINELDIEAPNLEGPEVYQIENAEAETLAETLNTLFSGTEYQGGYYYPVERDISISGLSGKVRVIAEPTTNSIIVLASSPRAFEKVEEMLKVLDRPSPNAGRTNIIKVKNALAADLALLLTDLFKPEESNQRSGSRSFFLDDLFGGSGGGGGRGSFSNLIGKVKIEADTRTNSLLVVTPDLYRDSVEDLISELDEPTSQVLLEVLIVEVTLGNEDEQGIQWGVDPQTGEVGRIAIDSNEVLTFSSDPSNVQDAILSPNGFLDFSSENLQFFSLNRTSFQAVINFLQSCRSLNVQSRPNILTENNRKALVRVGTRTPFVSEISQDGNFVNQSVEYEELGLTLEVTPHINSATEVSLQVLLTDGAIDPTVPPLNGVAFTFTDREFQTQLRVNDRHTVVLAGVISERRSEQVQEVPFLHRLPLVGEKVFTNRGMATEKVELLTFITPYILGTKADLLTATEMTMNKSQSSALGTLDLENGDWPEVYVGDDTHPLDRPVYRPPGNGRPRIPQPLPGR